MAQYEPVSLVELEEINQVTDSIEEVDADLEADKDGNRESNQQESIVSVDTELVTLVKESNSEGEVLQDGAKVDFRTDIEGLRGFCVMVVVLFHCGFPYIPGGFLGVDMFFVISGFVITKLLTSRLDDPTFTLTEFFSSRFLRLLPASAFVCFCTLCVGYFVLSPWLMKELFLDAKSVSIVWANMRYASKVVSYFSAEEVPSLLLHYWSLAVEEQFYFTWTFIYFCCMRVSFLRRFVPLIMVSIIIPSFVACIKLTFANQNYAFYCLPSRAWQILVGALVLELRPFTTSYIPGWIVSFFSALGLLFGALATVFVTRELPSPGFISVLPVFCTSLILLGNADSYLGVFLSCKFLRFIGARSYSIYLWHWPAIVVSCIIAYGTPFETGVSACLLALVFTLLLSEFSYRFLENFKRMKTTIKYGIPIGILISGAMFTVSSFGVELVDKLLFSDDSNAAIFSPTIDNNITSTTNFGTNITKYENTTDVLRNLMLFEYQLKLSNFWYQLGNASLVQQMPSLTRPRFKPRPEIDDGFKFYMCNRNGFYEDLLSGDIYCEGGDLQSNVTMVLHGDSHAAYWFLEFSKIGKLRNFRVLLFYFGTCSAYYKPFQTGAEGGPCCMEKCVQMRRWARETVFKLRAKYFVLSSWEVRMAADDKIEETLRSDMELCKSVNATLLVLGDNPNHHHKTDFDFHNCINNHRKNLADHCFGIRTVAVNKHFYDLVTRLSATLGFLYLETANYFCDSYSLRCPILFGDILIYLDGSHVSTFYMALIMPLVEIYLDLIRFFE